MLATKFRRPLAVGSLGLGLAISLTACGGSADEPMNDPSSSAPSSSAAPSDSSSPSDSMTEGSMDPAAMLVGSGCAAYAEQVPDGAGSVDGMAQAPVGTAASNNPILTTLTSAVSGGVNPNVNLVDTLNDPSAQYTVFAPVDDAFAKIPAETLASLSEGDGTALSSILTYHVLPERINPDDIDGTHTTVQGEDLTVEGSGDNITVNGNSAVICGGVQTANATVYLVDTVLMPPSTMQ